MRYIILLLLLISCASSNTLHECKKRHVVNTKKYWDKKLSKTNFQDRIGAPDAKLLEFLKLTNQIDKIDLVPRAYKLTKEEKRIVKRVIRRLPLKVRKKFQASILGVYFVENLGSSALTDYPSEYKKRGMMIFDKKVLRLTANEWCSWKESTPFKKGKHSLKCNITVKGHNTIEAAFEYIFLHELGHILTLNSKNISFQKAKNLNDKVLSFSKLSWSVNEKSLFPMRNKEIFPYEGSMDYYLPEPKVANERMLEVYKNLSLTNFPSMYGTINAWDDFAEAFVIYYHTKYLKKPWSISIKDGKNEVFKYKSCIITNKCPKKIKLIKEEFF